MSTHTGHSSHTAASSTSTRVGQPSAGNATITEMNEQIIANARILYSDLFKKYLSGKNLLHGPVRREDIFDIVVIRKPPPGGGGGGLVAVLVYGRPEGRKTAMMGEEKRSYFDAMESLLVGTAGKLGGKTRTERDGSKVGFWEE